MKKHQHSLQNKNKLPQEKISHRLKILLNQKKIRSKSRIIKISLKITTVLKTKDKMTEGIINLLIKIKINLKIKVNLTEIETKKAISRALKIKTNALTMIKILLINLEIIKVANLLAASQD